MQVLANANVFARGLLASIAVLGATVGAAGEPRSVRDVVYDYAVTSYCGVLTPEVEVGFRIELAEMTARQGLSAAQAKAQRIAGWIAADMEWSNRGLGGFRAWCQGEGLDAARHFQNIQKDSSKIP